MDYDESSDILGGRLHVSPQNPSVLSDPGQITLLLGLGLAAVYAWVRVAPHYRQWREARYRKAMRRRHGIPDDDSRPFNVAYAAALQARKAREGKGRSQESIVRLVPFEEADERLGQPVLQHAQQDFITQGPANHSYVTPSEQIYGVTRSSDAFPEGSAHPITSHDRTSQAAHPVSSNEHPTSDGGATPRLVTRSLHGKHALDDDADSELENKTKKTRVEQEQVIDVDEEAGLHDSNEEMDVDEIQPVKRGSKRVAGSDDDGMALPRLSRHEKRARKTSLDGLSPLSDQDMGNGTAHVAQEQRETLLRGRKRDRAEAGSTFGGDDTPLDDEDKPQRRRRKKTMSSGQSQPTSRGQKRGRDLHSVDSEDSNSDAPKRQPIRKKRGRRSHDEATSFSNDPLCKGRRIGDEWEAHGVQYKVGPNGQRLRLALVKKSLSKFAMPSDSQHPDRRANMNICIERWLSEEEFAAAKERNELAWQDPAPTSSESQYLEDFADSPSKAGKRLLWSSRMASNESLSQRGPFKQSVVTNVGLQLNVFPAAPVAPSRRIASVYQAPSSPATDSPKSQKAKTYSKWEKQDLEAAAMLKIRDRQHSAPIAEPSKPTLSIASGASFFGTTPAPSKASEKSSAAAPSLSFTPPVVSAGACKPTTSDAPKVNVPTGGPSAASSAQQKPAVPTFTLTPPASSGAAPAASTTSAFQSNASQANTSIPGFSKPATPAAPPSTTVTNFFAPKPASQNASADATSNGKLTQGSEPTKLTFSFGPPGATQAGTSKSSPFGNTANGSANPEPAKAPPGASLLSRLGMGPPPAQPSAAPSLSFGKPEANVATTGGAGGASSSSAAPQSSGPKFSFGITSKPSAPASTIAPAPTPAATAAAAAPASTTTSTPKPVFSFGVTNTNSTVQPSTNTTSPFGATPAKDAQTSAAPKPTFSFGTGGASAFGSTSGSSSATAAPSPFGAPASSKPAETPKPTFSFGAPSSGTSNPSPFGGAAASSAPSAFTAASSSASPFGSSGDAGKPTEAPKSAFSFGNASGTSSASPSVFGGSAQTTAAKTDGQTAKPLFSFGTPSTTPSFGASSTPAAAPAFGAPSTASSTTAFGGASAFGASSAPAAASKPTFSFGAPSSNTSSTPTPGAADNKPNPTFSFGTPSSNNATTPSAPAAIFGFGSQPANTASGTSSSPFGAAASNQQGSSAFGFGQPSGPFSFGSNASQNTQK